MSGAKQKIQNLFPLGTIMVLFLFASYRVIIEISYAKSWGYDTFSMHIVEFGVGMLILLTATIPMLLKFFKSKSFRFKFSFVAVQFLIAVLLATNIFNGGSFSGNKDIRMILLNIFTSIVFILLPVLFIFQINLFKKSKSNSVVIGINKQKFLSFGVFIPIILHLCLFGITMYFDWESRAPKPAFYNSYGRIFLVYPIPLLIILVLTIINIKNKKLSLLIASYAVAFLCILTAYGIIFTNPAFTYLIKNLYLFNIYATFTFTTAVTFVALWATAELFIFNIKQSRVSLGESQV